MGISASRATSTPAEPVKKNTEVIAQPAKTTPPPVEKREFSTANMPSIWAEVISGFGDATRNHLVKSSLQAISGPNVIEIVFPKAMILSKTYCNRPDLLRRIAEAILEITGTHVTCRVSEDQSSPAPVVEERAPVIQETERKRTDVVDHDPFVQMAVEIFSAKVADVRTVLTSGPVDE